MDKLSDNARLLGYAGILPQVLAFMAVLKGGPAGWSAEALAFGYAALIFSFVGGVWWGLGLAAPRTPRWIFAVAVLPSLIALALWFPWMVGETWPGPELIVLGVLIAASPLVDRAIGFGPAGWMALRWRLSLGLGGFTLAIGLMVH
ncbi:DUF3429 domain-containing protein [Novosphingobium sp.]|uniref:DUF3429 domain-containing protein n=1 Tax=Novosphingobium sp. TaxID=1874826 RepID=UPI003341A31E